MVHTIDLPTLRQLVRGGGVRLVHVVSEGRFLDRHIPGSIHVPLDDGAFDTRIQAMVPDRTVPLVSYCCDPSCPKSTEAARRLQRLGYLQVFDFKGGMDAWEAAGLDAMSGTRPPRPQRGAKRERAARLEHGRP